MARIVTPPATVTEPAAHALDAPNSRPDYPLVRPAPLSRQHHRVPGGGLRGGGPQGSGPQGSGPEGSGAKGSGAVTRALARLAGLRLTVTAVRLDLACGPLSSRDLAETLQSDLLLAEHRPGLGLIALYVGPRPNGPEGAAVVERRLGEELTRVLFSEQRYDLLASARVAMVHCDADLLSDGLLESSLQAADSLALGDLLPQAA